MQRELFSPSALQKTGQAIVFYTIVLIFLGFGAYKFTAAEAEAIYPLTSNSPLFSWLYTVLSKQGVSNLIGVAEIALALAMLWRGHWRVRLIGALGIAGALLSTLSFLITTPGIGLDGFIIKDAVLLGGALWAAGVAWQSGWASQHQSGALPRPIDGKGADDPGHTAGRA